MKKISVFILMSILIIGLLVGCTTPAEEASVEEETIEQETKGEVNLYTKRHY